MVNYTFIDTGPPVHETRQKLRHTSPQSLTPVSRPPESPPQHEQHAPPAFFERGNRARWLLLLVPIFYNLCRNGTISPHNLPPQQFSGFYIIFFLCSALITHLALKAKRRTLYNLLYTEPTAYYLEKVEHAYNKVYNTTSIPLACIVTGFAKLLHDIANGDDATPTAACTISAATIFLFMYKANSYSKCLEAKREFLSQPTTTLNNPTTFKQINYE